jgi:predicted PurR-regulated permease PerM
MRPSGSAVLLSQLIVNLSCGVPIGLGLALIGIRNAAL